MVNPIDLPAVSVIRPIFSIHDVRGKTFTPPYMMPNRIDAIRELEQEVNATDKSRNKVSMYPQDFELFQIGTFDECSGKIHVFDLMDLVARGSDFVKS